jgi:hypothetical protein
MPASAVRRVAEGSVCKPICDIGLETELWMKYGSFDGGVRRRRVADQSLSIQRPSPLSQVGINAQELEFDSNYFLFYDNYRLTQSITTQYQEYQFVQNEG